MTVWGTSLVRERDGKVLDVDLADSEDEARRLVDENTPSTVPGIRWAVVAIDPERSDARDD